MSRDWEIERGKIHAENHRRNLSICEAQAVVEVMLTMPDQFDNWTEMRLTELQELLRGLEWGNGKPWEANVWEGRRLACRLADEPSSGHSNRSLLGRVLLKLLDDIDSRTNGELRKTLRKKEAVV